MLNDIKGIIYDYVLWLARSGSRQKQLQPKLLIIRVDEIGDYVLWRNFLNEIVASPKFKHHEIHFCGNRSWKSLFDQFDASSVHKSFWIDKIRFKKELRYRCRFLQMIYRQGYHTVINPVFSRDKRYDDSIVRAASAENKIGMVANTESVQPFEMGYDKGLYTHLFEHPSKPIFEFYRNRMFTEFVTGVSSSVVDTSVPSALLPAYNGLPEKYIVIFPGSRSKTRIWPVENFIKVAAYLYEQKGFTAVVCGAAGDKIYTDAFCKSYPHPLLNLTGKTSLPEMLTVLQSASMLLSVDTGAVHLAAAVGCPVTAIFNGSQYKRFAPYPKELSAHFIAVYPKQIQQELADDEIVRNKYEFVIDLPYHLVTPEQVINEL
ncbi:MAG: glycosyltransferase family 9 protein [Bacteroidota bacterium]